MSILLLILRYTWPCLLCAGALGSAYLWADEGWDSARAQRAEKKLAADEQLLADARQRASDLALLWSAQITKSETALRQQQEESRAQFAALDIQKVPAGRVVVFSGIAGQLFSDITGAANAAATARIGNRQADPVPQPAATVATVAYDEREFVGYVKQAGVAYDDVLRKLTTCINTYDAVRADSIKEASP
jgi:hypothetical protein